MARKFILLMLVLSILCGFASAEQPVTLKAEIIVNADNGWPKKLVISGYNPNKEAWLGVSLYPYGTSDYTTGGRHSFIDLKKGDFKHEIKMDTELLGGSFEVGVWGTKVDKVDCTIDNCYWCKKNGFHHEDSKAYKSGLLTRLRGYE